MQSIRFAKGVKAIMAGSKSLVPDAKEALNRFKMGAADAKIW